MTTELPDTAVDKARDEIVRVGTSLFNRTGFYPGVILYCTYWFPSHRRARVIAMFMSAIPVAGIFGNPLSGWIMDHFQGVNGWRGWQWMFLLEAAPALVIGVITLFYLDDDVRGAKWLTDEEKAVVERAVADDTAHQTVRSRVRDAFREPRVWLIRSWSPPVSRATSRSACSAPCRSWPRSPP
ncbi:MFS transporter [Streptomyces malaysiensis]|uniref:Major facilitator superfamily (MFS) profile domain-containing protein n=1 Tax=Streptomyces malaysiensis TaxID=92644 RepID=A0A7X5WYU1_STRMQ|nr:MFS transporter [Streptomyces malaysiensis]NIY62770.1 hypothetical protein [Streptomyces malaysiensis]